MHQNQVDVGMRWKKSTLSSMNGSCVEVAQFHDWHVGVRDSKDAASPVLKFSAPAWRGFLGEVKAGRFDLQSGSR